MMIAFTLLLIASSTLAASIQEQKVYYHPADAVQHFEEFIQTYGRQYADEEEKQRRFEIFEKNLAEINQLNLDLEYTVYGINIFTDYSKEEMSRLSGVVEHTDFVNATVMDDFEPIAAPEAFDWRERNVVTRVKNQGSCGSCWAFGAIGSLESQYAMKNGQLMEFSEQELVDCDKTSQGCDRGVISNAIQYMVDNGGAMTEQDYPYRGVVGQCTFDASKAKVKVVKMNLIQTDEEQLKGILYQSGPIALAIDSSALHHYDGHVIPSCPQQKPSLHAVLLVGYGVDSMSKKYWLIKNSWGESWGDQGYFKLGRGSKVCGITQYQMVMPVIA